MLKLRKDNKQEKSVITQISDRITLESYIESCQKYFDKPLETLFADGAVSMKNDILQIDKPIKFSDGAKNAFIWDPNFPICFKDGETMNWPKIISSKSGYEECDISAWDVSNIEKFENKEYRFKKNFPKGIRSIAKLKVDNWNTSNFSSIKAAFEGFGNLRNLDLSTWDLTNVTDASYAFSNMYALETIKFNEKGMPKLVNAYSMFYLSGIDGAVLDLRGIKTGRIKDARHMFANSRYRLIDIRGWEFDPNCEFMNFADEAMGLEVFNGVPLTKAYYKFQGSVSDLCVDIIKNPEKYKRYIRSDRTFSNIDSNAVAAVQPYLLNQVKTLISRYVLDFRDNSFIVKNSNFIKFKADDNGNFIWPKEYPLYFNDKQIGKIGVGGNSYLPSIPGKVDLGGFNFAKATKLFNINQYIGGNCTEISLNGCDTSKIKYMWSTFEAYEHVKVIDLSTCNFENLKEFEFVFKDTLFLEKVIFKKQNLKNLRDVSGLFNKSGAIKAVLDLRDLQPENITKATSMFKSSRFSEIDIRGWKFNKACNYGDFATYTRYLEIFNGVKLDKNWLNNVEKIWDDWSRICIDIIEHPEKYEKYLVK